MSSRRDPRLAASLPWDLQVRLFSWPLPSYISSYSHFPCRCTKPGGYIEHLEISIQFKSEDGSVTEDHFMAQWSKTLLFAAEQLGKTFAIYDFNEDLIREAGFIDVQKQTFKVPVGPWPRDPKMKELGQWNKLFCLEGLESWSLYLLSTVLGVCPLQRIEQMARWDGILTSTSGRTKRSRRISWRCGRRLWIEKITLIMICKICPCRSFRRRPANTK